MDELGPWEPILPRLICCKRIDAKAKPIRSRVETAVQSQSRSIMRSRPEKGLKNPFPAKSISILDCFNQSFDHPPRKPPLIKRFRQPFRMSPSRKPLSKGTPLQQYFGRTVGGPVGPVSLALGGSVWMRGESGKVLAGRWEQQGEKMNTLMDALEGKLALALSGHCRSESFA